MDGSSAVNLAQLSHNDLLLYIQEQDRKLEQKTDEANRAWDIVQSQALELVERPELWAVRKLSKDYDKVVAERDQLRGDANVGVRRSGCVERVERMKEQLGQFLDDGGKLGQVEPAVFAELQKLKAENKLLISELRKYDPWEDTTDIVSEFDKLKSRLEEEVEESEDEIEDNDPEEYGEYMAKQHGKFPELMNGFDAETGEFKLPASIKKEDIEEKLAELREYLGRFGGDETEVFDKIMKGLE